MAHPQTRWLKHEAQRKLNVALCVRLSGRDLAERRVALFNVETTVALVPPLWSVGHIERFCAELHLEPLREREIFEQRDIYASLPRIVIALQAEGSGRSRRRSNHRRSIKPFRRAAAAGRSVFRVFSGHQVGLAVSERAHALRGRERERRASAEGQDAIQLPVADQPARWTCVTHPSTASPERQVVDKTGHKAVADIPGSA